MDADRRDRRGVRVVGTRGFMHKLRSAIDEAPRRICARVHVHFYFVGAFDKQDFGNTDVT